MNYAICIVSVSPLRSDKADSSEMISQLLFGECCEVLEKVEMAAPLDPEAWKMRANLALQFDDRMNEAKRGHAVERILLPNAVEIPLNQAESWGTLDLQITAELWQEALKRSAALEKLSTNPQGNRQQTRARIEKFARQSPTLKKLAESVLKQDGDE